MRRVRFYEMPSTAECDEMDRERKAWLEANRETVDRLTFVTPAWGTPAEADPAKSSIRRLSNDGAALPGVLDVDLEIR